MITILYFWKSSPPCRAIISLEYVVNNVLCICTLIILHDDKAIARVMKWRSRKLSFYTNNLSKHPFQNLYFKQILIFIYWFVLVKRPNSDFNHKCLNFSNLLLLMCSKLRFCPYAIRTRLNFEVRYRLNT
jgi:hypothetical protein